MAEEAFLVSDDPERFGPREFPARTKFIFHWASAG